MEIELDDVVRRIERRLKAVGLSANKASEEAGKPDAIRNLRRAAEKGQRGANVSTLAALAPVLKTSLAWLLQEEGEEETDGDDRGDEAMVPLVGYVGAGAKAHYYDVSQGELDLVPAPAGADGKTVAVEIRGTSLGAFFDRWLVFYDDVRRGPTPDLMHKLCVVGLEDGRILVKKLERGSARGLYDLHSQAEEPIRDVPVEWAARVKIMVPR